MSSKKQYLGLYGNISLEKAYCSDCETYAFVIDGKLQCCDKMIESHIAVCKRESICSSYRHISKEVKEKILESQENKCMFCGRTFGSLIFRKIKHHKKGNGLSEKAKSTYIRLRIHFDHLVPFVYDRNNSEINLVASCHVCNLLKSSLMFKTIDEAKIYLLNRWHEKGYYD